MICKKIYFIIFLFVFPLCAKASQPQQLDRNYSASFCCQGEVQESILPQFEKIFHASFDGKINSLQKEQIEIILKEKDKKIRIISFNMLFNHPDAEEQLLLEDRWNERKKRLVAYIKWANPDIIGSQELEDEQIQYLMDELGDCYAFCDGKVQSRDRNVIFYNKNRFLVEEDKGYYFSNCSLHKTGKIKPYLSHAVHAKLFDRKTSVSWDFINTHLSFSSLQKRLSQAQFLHGIVRDLPACSSIVVMGDLNTFPFRTDIELPFYDGDTILTLLKGSILKDVMEKTVLGHIGPISSTNYCPFEKKTFCGLGTPGVILDHILVNEQVDVVVEGIDPAKIDGRFPSDHFPVVAEIISSEK